MNTRIAWQRTVVWPTMFTWAEWRDLLTLRGQYRQGRDLFSERERAYLRFVRWLYWTAISSRSCPDALHLGYGSPTVRTTASQRCRARRAKVTVAERNTPCASLLIS